MNFDNIRNNFHVKAGNRYNIAREKAKAEMEGIQKAYESYLDGVDDAIRAIERLPQETPVASPTRNITPADVPKVGLPKFSCKFRHIVSGYIDPSRLKDAIEQNMLDEVIRPFDEIDIPLDNGETVTVVCGYSDSNMARFVFKDCWDEHVMNEENTNKTGYYGSAGRKHVLEDIYPHLPQDWKDIITSRHLSEVIGGELVEYDDPLWLPSATDVFGPPAGRGWPEEPDSFQLPIFQRERDRVKECGESGTYPWWLRSVYAADTMAFCRVSASGAARYSYAYHSLGFAPGFDI